MSSASQPRLIALVLVLGLLPACVGERRPPLGPAEMAREHMADRQDFEKSNLETINRLVLRLGARYQDYKDGKRPTPPTIDVLALSGGGDWGAFGSGFLVGWGECPDPLQRRPSFDAVTGVSTGAVIAPFAYLGTDEDVRRVDDLYRNPRSDWARNRGVFFFLPSFPSFMTIPGLERDLRQAIDAPMIARVAEQSREGKALVISTTNLDLGSQRIWSLGLEAEEATRVGSPERVQRIILASAAIPVVFPPHAIGSFLFADGGVTANLCLRLDVRDRDGFLQTWHRRYRDWPCPKVRYWLLINNQFRQAPRVTEPTWPAITETSLVTAVRAATYTQMQLLCAQADAVNAAELAEVEVRVAAVPDDWRPPVEGTFKKETMVALSDLGQKMGADPNSWQLWASPATLGILKDKLPHR
jgi:hypothetical protein